MRTRSWIFSLFVFLVAVPVGAAAYLGSVGLSRERSMLIDRERSEMNHRADEMRDRLVYVLQQLYRTEAARDPLDYVVPDRSALRSNDTRAPVHDYFILLEDGTARVPWGTPDEVPGDISALARTPQEQQEIDSGQSLRFVAPDLAARRMRVEGKGSWELGFRVDVARIQQRFLDPASSLTIMPERSQRVRLDRLVLVREADRRLNAKGGPHGLPLVIYRHVVPAGRNDDPVLLPAGYLLAAEMHPSPVLDAALADAEARLRWILGAVAVVVITGMLFAWRAVRAESRLATRKAEFVSAVSHELRTPLTSIRMYADMLKEGWIKDEQTAKEYFALISAESERLARLVNNVLDFSRIEKGRKRFEMQVGDPSDVIRDVGEVLRPYLKEKGFELNIEVPEQLPPCSFDRDALTQILVNLIDNAVKYGDREVKVEAEARDGTVVLRVLDRGPGVPPGERERIFEPFQRGSSAERGGGSGLGLALVRHYATQHHGRIDVGERPGGGAVFALSLPAA